MWPYFERIGLVHLRNDLSERDLAFDISEDWKLRNIGIDPDGNPFEIMAELDRRVAEFDKKRGWSFEPEDTDDEPPLE